MKGISNWLIILTLSLASSSVSASRLNSTGLQNEDLFLVREGNKIGYVNNQGKVTIPLSFDEGDEFFEGFARIKINQKWGFVDTRGKIIIPEQYDYVGNFGSGLAAVFIDKDRNRNPTYGYIDSSGTIVIPIKYVLDMATYDFEATTFRDGKAIIKIDGKYGYINLQGKLTFPGDIFEDKYFSEGLAVTNFGSRGARNFGYVDIENKTVIPPQFSTAAPFSEGLAAVGFGPPVVVRGDRFSPISEFENNFFPGTYALFGNAAFINKKGEVIISFNPPMLIHPSVSTKKQNPTSQTSQNWPGTVHEFRSFSQGLAAVKFGDKWGYIDRTGHISIQPQFDDAYDFRRGIATVKLNAKHALISLTGKMIWQAKD